MARNTKGTLSMIKEKAKANSLGKMEEFTMECGEMENNMAEGSSFLKRASKE